MKTAFQMDPIETIDIKGDSTFALLLEAQARGHEIFYYLPDALSLAGNRLIAFGQDLEVVDKPGQHAKLGDMRNVDLKDMDGASAPGPAV